MTFISALALRFIAAIQRLADLPPFIFRLILAYGFYEPAMTKWKNLGGVAEWFGQMGIPFPTLNAYMAASTEAIGVALLTLGLATRFISIPLMVVMVVAVVTVHWSNGFACGKNGFEVPFYYFFMLFSLLVTGAGRISVDAYLKRRFAR